MAFIEDLAGMLGEKDQANAYEPKHIKPSQVKLESGGQQLDKNGKPLVGRRSNGELPRVEERAYGAGQIQIRTARNTALKHGKPWDESKLMTDKDYNLEISDLHKGDLLAYYKGDETLANAAYHSGQPKVDRAVKNFGRAKFYEGLGPDGKHYVKTLNGEGAGAVAGSGSTQLSIPASAFDGLVPSNGVKGTPATDYDREAAGDSENAFSMAPEIQEDAQRVNKSADFLGDILTGVSAGLSEEMGNRREILEEKVAAQSVILDEQLKQTQQMKEQVKPIFARRAAIAERKTELMDMGGLERTFAGIFNRNYDREYLDQLDGTLVDQLKQVGSEFEESNRYNNQINAILNEKWAGQESISRLMTENLGSTLQLAQTSLGVAQARLQASTGQAETGVGVIRAQLALKDDAFRQIGDLGTINTLLGQAKAGGGSVMVNGVPLTEQELIEHGKRVEGQDNELKLRRLALQNGLTQGADQAEARYLEYLTPGQRAELVKNNGVGADGTQYSMATLQNLVAADTAAIGQTIAGVVDQGVGSGLQQVNDRFLESTKFVNNRASQIFGVNNPELAGFVNGALSQVNQIADQLRGMPNGPAKDTLRAKYTELYARMEKQRDQIVDGLIKTQTRNPDGQMLFKAWMTGQIPTGEQAARGFIALSAGGNIPPGIDPNSPAGKTIAEMTRAQTELYNRVGGKDKFDSMMAGKNKETAAEAQKKLMTAVTEAAKTDWTNRQGNAAIDSIPAWAKADGHPAGQIRVQDIRNAQVQGDRIGSERMKTTNVKPGDPKYAATLANLQAQAMMSQLDRSPSGELGFRPSEVLSDFMSSNNFQGRIRAFDENAGKGDFGNMLVTAIAGQSAMSGRMANFASAFKTAAQANDQVERDSTISQAAQYRGDPVRKFKAVFAAAEDLNPAEEEALMTAYAPLFRQMQSAEAQQLAARQWTTNQTNPQTYLTNQIIAQIKTQKLEDPGLESIRRKIAPKLESYVGSVDRAMRALEN